MNIMYFAKLFYLILIYTCCVFCQEKQTTQTTLTDADTSKITSSEASSTSSSSPTSNATTEPPPDSCEKCIHKDKGFYCQTDGKCYPNKNFVGALVPDSKCPISKRYFTTCKLNLMWLMILSGSAVGIVLIGLICCCCCCCKSNGRIRLSKDDLKWARQKEERRKRAEQQRLERAARTDDIRRKYGLFKDDTPYQRFDA